MFSVPSADTVEHRDLAGGDQRERCLHGPVPARGCGKASLLAQLSRFSVPPTPVQRQTVRDNSTAQHPPAPARAPVLRSFSRSIPLGLSLEGHSSTVSNTRVLPPRKLAPTLQASSESQDCPVDRNFPGAAHTPDPRLAACLNLPRGLLHVPIPARWTPCSSPELSAAGDAAWFPGGGFRPGRRQTLLLRSLQGSADGSSNTSRRRLGRRAPLADRWWAETRAAHRLSWRGGRWSSATGRSAISGYQFSVLCPEL